jgi:hypothetical protein
MPHNVLEQLSRAQQQSPSSPTPTLPNKQAQHSIYAKTALMSRLQHAGNNNTIENISQEVLPPPALASSEIGGANGIGADGAGELKPKARFAPDLVHSATGVNAKDGVGHALSDTPLPSLPNSPKLYVCSPYGLISSTPKLTPFLVLSCETTPPAQPRAYVLQPSTSQASPNQKSPQTVALPNEMSAPNSSLSWWACQHVGRVTSPRRLRDT